MPRFPKPFLFVLPPNKCSAFKYVKYVVLGTAAIDQNTFPLERQAAWTLIEPSSSCIHSLRGPVWPFGASGTELISTADV